MQNLIVEVKKKIRFASFCFLNRFFSLSCPLNEKKVLFLSDVRATLGGNMEYIYNYLEGKEFERVIHLKADRNVKRGWKEKFKLAYDISTSKYIILDDFVRFISLTKVRKNQEICQLWHGAGAFKKFGYSRQDKADEGTVDGHRNYTKACVTGEDIRWCFAEGFGMDVDQVQAVGMPRMDDFYDEKYVEQKKKEVYSEFPFLQNKKVILFAPTYRGASLLESYYDFDELDLDKIYEKLKDKGYVFVFKWHPGLYFQMQRAGQEPYDFKKYSEFYYDLSTSRDINDLLLVTDVLVTDYSSVIFDYLLVDKPLVYFTYDYEKYAKDRGLYFEFDEYVYGSVTKDTDELIEAIEKADLMPEKRENFRKKFMSACDGHSTEKICQWVFGIKEDER